MVTLPDDVRERMDAVADYYGLPADLLAQKFLTDVINGIYVDQILALEKAKREAP